MCFQIDSAKDDDELRSLFTDCNNESILLETGFRLPLCRLICTDKGSIKSAIRDYHSLIKIKPELDQFASGLETLGVLQVIKKYPALIAPLFTKHENAKKIDKGMKLAFLELLLVLFMLYFDVCRLF